MREFWDARAAEDAYYFVDNRLRTPTRTPRFWRGGERCDGSSAARVESAGDELVEIGCGIGRLTRPLAARAASVRALDVSPRMLELARAHNPGLANVDWVLGDGAPLAPARATAAPTAASPTSSSSTCRDPAITLGYVREMGRVLRPGGLGGRSRSPTRPRSTAARRSARRARGLGSTPPAAAARAARPTAAWRGSAVDLG